VIATPLSANVRKVSRTASSSGSAFVSRFDVGQISRTISCSRSADISAVSPAARMPWPMRSGRSASTTSNLLTKALPDDEAVRDTFRTFADNGVAITIATDGPEMMRTHLRDEFELLLRVGALDEDELRAANERAHEASFIGRTRAASLV